MAIAERMDPEMSRKLDRMIGARRFTVHQMAKACGTSEDNVKQRRKRRNRILRRGDKGGQIVVPSSSTIIEEVGPEDPECPPDVPSTPASVMAELRRMLKRQQAMERAFQDDGPAATPAILAILGEQRKTIEAILKAQVVFANMPARAEEPAQQRAARGKAYWTWLLDNLSPAAREEVLKLNTERNPP